MKTIRFYAVSVMADCEGRSSKTIARFSTFDAANAFSTTDQGRDMYGGAGRVSERNIQICDTLDEACEVTFEEMKKKALAKLSAQDKAVLGLEKAD